MAMDRDMLLEKYLNGSLSEAEREAFDAELAANPAFREKVEFEVDVQRAVVAEENQRLRDLMTEFDAEAEQLPRDQITVKEPETADGKVRRLRIPRRWMVAASVVFLAALTYFLIPGRSASPQDLYADYFEPYANVVHPIVRGEQATDFKTLGFAAYSNGEYEAALENFSEAASADKQPYYLFYRANALLALGRAREAIPLLESYRESGDSLAAHAPWYLALANLQTGDVARARELLEQVASEEALKAGDARELLDALD